MTKAKTARAQLPGQPSDAEPVAPPPAGDTPVEPGNDEAGTPPADPPPPEAQEQPAARPLVLVDVRRLEVAQALPEVDADADTLPTAFNHGAVQRFKASDTDRRTMEIVALPDGSLASRAVTTEEA